MIKQTVRLESVSERRSNTSKSASVRRKGSTKEDKVVQKTEGEKGNSNSMQKAAQEPYGFHTWCMDEQLSLRCPWTTRRW